jgi:protein TonB
LSESARKSNLSGEVILKLIINPTGGIEHIQIEKGLGYGCDKEAIRLIEGGPIWKPATIDHVPVKDTISITVKFNHSE